MSNDSLTTKNIAIIGSTGSIGTQTLDIVARHPDRYRVTMLSAGRQVDKLIEQSRRFRPQMAIIADESLLPRLHAGLADTGIECAAGAKALEDAMSIPETNMTVTATVGYSGLAPTIAAIRAGKDIALANKETLVVAGQLINTLMEQSTSRIFPVDSEHSAIAQCIAGENGNAVESLIITASGGPFRTWNDERLAMATAADALKHPNWSMGDKITIDSATLVNKAFELIEAHYLFGVEPSKIRAIVHPQSIVHSMVEFVDGAIKAQLGVPDMRLPIAYALGENNRLQGASGRLTLDMCRSLTFEEPDTRRFPCLTLANLALERRGNTACVFNAANEVANLAFRQGRIRFVDFYPIIMQCIESVAYIAEPGYDDFVATNAEARAYATEIITKLN